MQIMSVIIGIYTMIVCHTSVYMLFTCNALLLMIGLFGRPFHKIMLGKKKHTSVVIGVTVLGVSV